MIRCSMSNNPQFDNEPGKCEAVGEGVTREGSNKLGGVLEKRVRSNHLTRLSGSVPLGKRTAYRSSAIVVEPLAAGIKANVPSETYRL
jgi:hypothetical protein